jgi:hypothetical protein
MNKSFPLIAVVLAGSASSALARPNDVALILADDRGQDCDDEALEGGGQVTRP